HAVLKNELKSIQEQALLLEKARQVYSPAGVRSHILTSVTPFLNIRTAEYLNTLSDGNIVAEWSTMETTKKGEYRDKFNISVIKTGSSKSFQTLSGGEKRKVRIACSLALQDLVASRASKNIELFIGDEIDDALDTAGLERLMGILEAKARERGTVMIISHKEMKSWFREIITVEVKEGRSYVV
ncbi:exonuclease, partial [Escherichia coli]